MYDQEISILSRSVYFNSRKFDFPFIVLWEYSSKSHVNYLKDNFPSLNGCEFTYLLFKDKSCMFFY